MSLEALFRMHLGGLFWTAVACLVVWLILSLIIKHVDSAVSPDEKTAPILKPIRDALLAVMLITAAIWLVDGLITNATPRAIIDRDGVNQQQEDREKRLRREAQEAKQATPAPTEEKR